MNLLHVGTLSPHVHRVIRMFRRYAPDVHQEHVQAGERPMAPFHLVLVHGVNQFPRVVERVSGVPVVGWMWNTDWTQAPGADRVRAAMQRCALILGDSEAGWAAPEGVEYLGHRTLVDAEVFRPDPPMVRTGVLIARGWQGHPMYWADETRQALEGMPGVGMVSGHMPPVQMNLAYRRARCVVALREDCGPSYTVVEAVLSGAIPVVSDCPAIGKHFGTGAFLVGRDPGAIREGVERALSLPDGEREAWVARNRDYFGAWTEQAQGPALVARVLEAAGVRAAIREPEPDASYSSTTASGFIPYA